MNATLPNIVDVTQDLAVHYCEFSRLFILPHLLKTNDVTFTENLKPHKSFIPVLVLLCHAFISSLFGLISFLLNRRLELI
jgi:hypothetical protein